MSGISCILKKLADAEEFCCYLSGRTGSAMLMTALQNHTDICAHAEVFNNRSDDNLEFVGIDYQNLGITITL